ncbi:hypothetical protein SAMN05444000_10386 [Shimia gijangensis]|uniref:Uncharacterized protein n=1 Tax=Shimia gijangensis TaxID=1470563 RepID=A0A1M6E2C3_9RHOB|nr:hypothetical protein [Shimia gijangensis]SHI79652.1 hypothetical protein SAMN05444000_10386 [Shimia gijangensis]
MTVDELLKQARNLSEEIKGTEGQERYDLHQKLHRAIENIRLQGGHVPAYLRDLDLDLVDEEVEDVFDNMPV